MSVLAFIVFASLWMAFIWLVSLLITRVFSHIDSWPEYWLSILAVGICVPFSALIYLSLNLTIPQNLVVGLSSVSGIQALTENTSLNSGYMKYIALTVYISCLVYQLTNLAKAWGKLSRHAKQKNYAIYESINIISVSNDIPPCSFGVFKPVVLMPKNLIESLSSTQLNLIYAHEVAHIKTRDPFFMLVFIIIRALCWPHYCVHDLYKRWQFAIELRADSQALIGASKNLRKTYGQLLVGALRKSNKTGSKINSRETLPCPSASLSLNNYRSAKMRVKNIMNTQEGFRKSRAQKIKLTSAMLVGFICGSIGLVSLASETVNRDRDAQPLTRVPPVFPKNCSIHKGKFAAKVRLKFDVSKLGQPQNIRITDSDNSCFNAVSIMSLEKWTYAPVMENGKARKRKNVESMLIFKHTPLTSKTNN
ncbi:MAG: hypothetical protein COA43_04360 [Robiginitomaculum sp.]|nr:MAG: hypothetical protein COA43_04360 [Robiginitomaculum sp.]